MNPKTSIRRALLQSALLTSVVSTPGVHANPVYWDVNGPIAGSGNGGGFWEASNWNTVADGTSMPGLFTAGNTAIFAAGNDFTGNNTVTVGASITTPSIIVEEAGNPFTITGGSIVIGGGSVTTSALGAATNLNVVIASALAGSGGLTVAAHGDMSPSGGGSNSHLRLSGENTFTGNITVTSGLLGLPTDASFGAAGNELILNGGGFLESAATRTLTRNIQIGAAGGTIRTLGSTTLDLNGSIIGGGALNRTDGGTVNLNTNGTGFTGTFNIQGGTVRMVASDWSGTPFHLRNTSSVLRTVGSGTKTIASLDTDRDVHIEAGTRLNVATGNIDFATANFWIQNAGALTSSSGTLTVNTPTHYNTATDQSIRVRVEDFNGSTPLALVKNGSGQINQFDQPNTYSGGTTINGGRIRALHPQAFGTGTVTVNDGGQALLEFVPPATNHFVINGLGAVENAGVFGAIRLNNLGTLAGDTTVASASRIALAGGDASHAFITGRLLGSAPLEINNADATSTLADGTIHFSGDGSGYTGTLTVARGLFNLASTLGGHITVGDNGRLNLVGTVAGNGTVDGRLHLTGTLQGNLLVTDFGTLSGGGTVSGNLTLGEDFGANRVILDHNDPLTVNGGLELIGISYISIPQTSLPAGTYGLLNYGGPLTGNAASNLNFDIIPADYRQTFALDTSTPGVVNLIVTGNAGNLVWNGSDNGNWDINLTENWLAPAPSTFLQGDAVSFTDAAANKAVTMQGSLMPGSITVNNSAENNYTISGSGSIGGGASLTKAGAGRLTLGGANTFTGPVAINQGYVSLTSARAFGNNSGVAIAAGAQLDINGQNAGAGLLGWDYTIAGDGPEGAAQPGAIINTGAAAIAATGIRSLTLSGDASLSTATRFDIGSGAFGTGIIHGNGFTLTKKGSGTMALRGSSAQNVNIVVEAGRLWAENFDLALGDATGSLTIKNGARGGTFGARTIPVSVTIEPGGILHNQGGGIGTWTGPVSVGGDFGIHTEGQSIALTGSIAGTGNLTRTGANVLALQNNAASWTGKILNNEGTLRIAADAALGAVPGAPVADTITMAAGTTLQSGTIAAQASASLHANRGITLGNGDVNFDAGAGNTLTIGGPLSDAGENVGNLVKPNNAGNLVFGGPVDLAGYANLNGGTAVFNGPLNVPGNSLRLQNGVAATINSPSGVVGTSEANGGLRLWASTLNINVAGTLAVYDIQVGEASGLAGTVNHTSGAVDVTADVRIGHWPNNTSVYNISGGSLNLLGTVTSVTDEGQANLFLGIDGTGVLTLSGTGVVNASSMVFDGRGATAGDDTLNLTGGALNIGIHGMRTGPTGTGHSYKINLGGGVLGATAGWNSSLNMEFTGTNGDVTIATGTHSIVLSGVLSGAGGFTKTGTGFLTLSGVNTYTGATRVNEGTLSLLTDSLDNNSEVRIGASGVLDLAHTAADTVRFLYINGSPMAPGTYGSSFSGATNVDDVHFAGTGMLQVTETGSAASYDAWAEQIPNASRRGFDADADDDGISNGLEYVLNGNPNASDSGILPVFDDSGAEAIFVFYRNDDSLADTVQTVQYGSDLAGWTDIPVHPSPAPNVLVEDQGGGVSKITVTLAKLTPRMFVRLKVAQ